MADAHVVGAKCGNASDEAGEPFASAGRVTVRVVNGHLKHATHPVLVGHYIGDSLNGSERILDKAQGNRISRRRARGLHPAEIGTFDVHLAEGQEAPPGSAIVGLGQVSELTGGSLKRTVQRGMLALAEAMDERDAGQRPDGANKNAAPPRGISCVLVGSGGGVLALSDCLLAILRATHEANHILEDKAFGELELIEWVEQRAITAWHTIGLHLERRAELREAFTLKSEVESRRGGWRRIGPDDDPFWWTPVTIRALDDELSTGSATLQKRSRDRRPLKFVAIAERARAEGSLVATRRALVDRYLQRVTSLWVEQGPTAAARTLFELLWPSGLKEHSLDDRGIRLIVDEEAASLPWEMMDDRRPWITASGDGNDPEVGPPAVRRGMIRQLLTERMREPGGGSSRKTALVIGDPRAEASGLDELLGAQAEARLVAKTLKDAGFEVTPLIGADAKPEEIISALFADAWQVIHIAAHGVFNHRFADDPEGEVRTGIVLGGQPKPIILDSEILNQLPIAPEFAFINCCSLGSLIPSTENEYLRSDRPALASSIAVQLIRMGVRAVIAAGWKVDDEPGKIFAKEVYAGLVDGVAFGQVVWQARASVYAGGRSNSTWGAYQCYGHPDFRLPSLEPKTAAKSLRLATPSEAVSEIERIAALGNVGGERDQERDLAALERIEKHVSDNGWLKLAEVRSALGGAFGDLGKLDRAISHYTAAALAEHADVPIRAVEQCLNFVVKRADQRIDESERDQALVEIRDAIERLEALIRVCDGTLERWSLVGSGHKRLAQRTAGTERTNALARMVQAYQTARKIGHDRQVGNVFYPWSQEIAGEVVVALRGGGVSRPDFAELRHALQVSPTDDFWLRVLPTDLRVLELVAANKLSEAEVEKVVQQYLKVWGDTGSRREMAAVLQQIGFLIRMLEDIDPTPKDRLEKLAILRQRLDEATQ